MEKIVTEAFQRHFEASPEFVIRAPGRVNLIGEHTDYNDGFVLPMAIDRAVWMAIRPRSDGRVYAVSLDFEEPADFALDQIEHTDAGWSEYLKGMATVLLEAGYALSGWEGVIGSDVPIGSGLSSSAALEMATARAFAALSRFKWQPKEMALLGQRTENEWMGANTGIMDQMISASGQKDHALLIDCRDLSTRPLPLPPSTAVVIMDTMTRHTHTESGYNERREQCETAARHFGVSHLRDVSLKQFEEHAHELDEVVRRRARHVISENDRVLQAGEAMTAGDAAVMGQLMNASHVSMRDDFEITNEQLNLMVAIAQEQAGCYGARMTGGGFGGCAVALVEDEKASAFAADVANAYRKASGLEPKIYVSTAVAGAAVWEPSN